MTHELEIGRERRGLRPVQSGALLKDSNITKNIPENNGQIESPAIILLTYPPRKHFFPYKRDILYDNDVHVERRGS